MDRRRVERRVTFRRRTLLLAFLLAVGGLVARAAQVQVVEGPLWAELAERQHRRTVEVPGARGAILDRDGAPLAESHERYRVAVAPREVTRPAQATRALVSALDLDGSAAARAVTARDPWVVLPGRYPPRVRQELAGIRGVHLERELDRLYPHGDLGSGVLGRVREGAGVGGIEQTLDSILRGRAGREVRARDNVGRAIPGESYVVTEPRPGNRAVLTLDLGLQEIARETLEAAIEETGAHAGDLLITDPRSGEVLALASLRDGSAASLTAINTPYEPGSTLKPFTVAGLLARGLASLSDTVDGGGGRWRVEGRTLSDVHPFERMSIADALRVSSNVGVAKAARAYEPAEQYKVLRDFGFGVATGIELPGESPGTLRRPEGWSRQSPASLAIGYEIAVTPIQMAMAFGALANGGWLMEPRIVREVRGPDGRVLRRRPPRKIRRVLPEDVTRRIGRVLVDVVEEGTGTAARLSTFRVAGKSGTSRAYTARGGYDEGGYFASFVGYFPAEDPQLVVFVKLERPRGSYYGGAAAAPVTRATLEAILAARRAPLDRRALIHIARRTASRVPSGPVRFASLFLTPETGEGNEALRPARIGEAGVVPVPRVAGLPVRSAVRRLHGQGFRIRWEGGQGALRTVPGPGTRLPAGDTVLLRGGP